MSDIQRERQDRIIGSEDLSLPDEPVNEQLWADPVFRRLALRHAFSMHVLDSNVFAAEAEHILTERADLDRRFNPDEVTSTLLTAIRQIQKKLEFEREVNDVRHK